YTVGEIATDIFQTQANNIGKEYSHWNGVDVGVRARLQKQTLAGGLSTGRTSLDNCDVVGKLIAVNATSGGGLINFATGPLYCHQDTNFLTQVKGYGSYTLPADVQLAATFQSIPSLALAS